MFYSQLSVERRSKTHIMTNKIKTPPEDRIYDDDDGFFLRAASVCVRDQNESEVINAIRKHYFIFLIVTFIVLDINYNFMNTRCYLSHHIQNLVGG